LLHQGSFFWRWGGFWHGFTKLRAIIINAEVESRKAVLII
jgi:hypothetical protein